MTAYMNLMSFLSLMFPCILNLASLPWTSVVFDYPLGKSENAPCLMLAQSSNTVPPPGVPLP